MNAILDRIRELSKRLRKDDPQNTTLAAVDKWIAMGAKCAYSNQDFDMLNGLQVELNRVRG